jgi:hypothetical protein
MPERLNAVFYRHIGLVLEIARARWFDIDQRSSTRKRGGLD